MVKSTPTAGNYGRTRKPTVPPVARTLPRKTSPAATATKMASAPIKAVKTAQPKVTDTIAAIAWDMLPPADVVVYTRSGGGAPRIDREKDTPEVVKGGLAKGFDLTVAAGLNGQGKEKPVYQNQRCGSAPVAEAFEKAAKAYAKFRDWTLRGHIMTDGELNIAIQKGSVPAATPSGSVYTFAVKSKETRVRK